MDIFQILLFYDVWFYGVHRLMHVSPLLMPFHKIHHQVTGDKITLWDAGSAHIVENILTNTGFLIPSMWASSRMAIVLSFLFISVRGLLRHDPRSARWIGRHHLDHHKYPDYNFSSYPVDLFFGTVKPIKNFIK